MKEQKASKLNRRRFLKALQLGPLALSRRRRYARNKRRFPLRPRLPAPPARWPRKRRLRLHRLMYLRKDARERTSWSTSLNR
jgi:hypothetical protein